MIVADTFDSSLWLDPGKNMILDIVRECKTKYTKVKPSNGDTYISLYTKEIVVAIRFTMQLVLYVTIDRYERCAIS